MKSFKQFLKVLLEQSPKPPNWEPMDLYDPLDPFGSDPTKTEHIDPADMVIGPEDVSPSSKEELVRQAKRSELVRQAKRSDLIGSLRARVSANRAKEENKKLFKTHIENLRGSMANRALDQAEAEEISPVYPLKKSSPTTPTTPTTTPAGVARARARCDERIDENLDAELSGIRALRDALRARADFAKSEARNGWRELIRIDHVVVDDLKRGSPVPPANPSKTDATHDELSDYDFMGTQSRADQDKWTVARRDAGIASDAAEAAKILSDKKAAQLIEIEVMRAAYPKHAGDHRPWSSEPAKSAKAAVDDYNSKLELAKQKQNAATEMVKTLRATRSGVAVGAALPNSSVGKRLPGVLGAIGPVVAFGASLLDPKKTLADAGGDAAAAAVDSLDPFITTTLGADDYYHPAAATEEDIRKAHEQIAKNAADAKEKADKSAEQTKQKALTDTRSGNSSLNQTITDILTTASKKSNPG